MSSVMRNIKSFFGVRTEKSCFDRFHETADRVAAKSQLVLAERNNFAIGANRIKARRKKAKGK